MKINRCLVHWASLAAVGGTCAAFLALGGGCASGGFDAPETATVAPETRGPQEIESEGGDVDARTSSETESAAGSSIAAEGARDISTVRYGLDDGTAALLTRAVDAAFASLQMAPYLLLGGLIAGVSLLLGAVYALMRARIGFQDALISVGVAAGGLALAAILVTLLI